MYLFSTYQWVKRFKLTNEVYFVALSISIVYAKTTTFIYQFKLNLFIFGSAKDSIDAML